MAAPELRKQTWDEQLNMQNAIEEDNADYLQQILKRGINVNFPIYGGNWMPLHYAVYFDSINCASLLISDFKCNLNVIDKDGRTPLKLAIIKNSHKVLYLLVAECNQQISHLSQEYQDKAIKMIEQYKREHPEIIRNKLNQDIVDFMLQVRKADLTIKVRYGKVVLAGSSAAGKTSFFRLLMKQHHCQKHISTGLAETQQVTIAMKAHIQSLTHHDDVEFKALNFDDEISQLRSHLHGKLQTEPSLQNRRSFSHSQKTTLPKSSYPQVLTAVEENIAAYSEVKNLPQQPIEDVWNILTFIDTGGLPQFISMLPTVNSTAMITFVVHKMEGGAESLHKQVTVAHGNSLGEHSFMPYCIGQTNLDLIKALMSFTNNIFLKNKPFLDKICCKLGNSGTCLSIIGTHSDKVTKEDVSETDKIITRTVLDAQLKKVWMQLVANYGCLIPINNITAGKVNEDENAAKIRKKLNQLLQEQSVYEVPIVWVLLELEIRKVCNDRYCSFITYSEILKICKEKQLSNDEEFIKNGLRFHHLFGVLLYFEEVEGMKNIVITDHQWLFDNLTKILCQQYSDFSDVVVYKDFVCKGIFHKSLLDKIDLGTESIRMLRINEKAFDLKTSFLHLLNHLYILAPLKVANETYAFFMPSLLSTCNFNTNQLKFLEEQGSNISSRGYIVEPLLIQFTKSTVPSAYGTFPRGVFCCLAVYLLNYNPSWRLQWSIDKEIVFDNLITFLTETGHFITLMDKLLFLEIQVRHQDNIDPLTCFDIYETLCCSLNTIGQNLQFYDFQLSFGFTCKCSKESHVTRYSSKSKYSYCCYDQPTEVTESHLIWFRKKELESKLPGFDKEILQAMKDAKLRGLSIKARHSKVLFCGSSKNGKSSFMKLLLNEKLTEAYEPTKVAESNQLLANEIRFVNSKHEYNIEHINFEKQIEWLRGALKNKKYTQKNLINQEIFDKSNAPGEKTSIPSSSSLEEKHDQVETIPSTSIGDKNTDQLESDLSTNVNDQQKQISDVEDMIATSDANMSQVDPPDVWNMLTFLDTGGQPAFINMLPALTTSAMITFIIYSMEDGVKKLNKIVPVYGEGFEYLANYRYIDFIKMLFSMRKVKEEQQFEEILDKECKADRKCYLSLVGTKSDKWGENANTVAEEIGEQLEPIINQTICKSSLIPIDGGYFVPVSNLNAGKDNEDLMAAKFRKRIYKQLEKRDIYYIPIVWLILELELKHRKEREVFSIDEVHKICKDSKLIEDKENIRKALQFFHHIGVFLYYGSDEDMKKIDDIVITKHQWIFKNLHSIFEVSKSNKAITKRFRQDGCLDEEVINETEWKLGNDVKPEYFLKLLEKLGIISAINNNEYFMPCVLPHISTNSSHMKDLLDNYGVESRADPLLIQFSFELSKENRLCRDDNHSYLFPAGVFCCLINQLHHKCSKFNRKVSVGNDRRTFNNLIILGHKIEKYYVVLIDNYSYLEIHIRHDTEVTLDESVYSEIRCMIKSNLETVLNKLNLDISQIWFAFQCSANGEDYLIRKKTDEEYFYRKNDQQQLAEQQMIWFSEPSKPPSEPEELTVDPKSVTHESLTLLWRPPIPSNRKITGYILQYKKADEDFQTLKKLHGNSLTHTVAGLTANTEYYFRVAAVNSVGCGSYKTALDSQYTKPEEPEELNAEQKDIINTTVTLSWKPPNPFNGSVSEYIMEYKLIDQAPMKCLIKNTEYEVTGLIADKEYEFKVAAVNKAGCGPFTKPFSLHIKQLISEAELTEMANSCQFETINKQDNVKIECLIDETEILLITANENENKAVLSFLKPRSSDEKLLYCNYEFCNGFLKRTAVYAFGKFGQCNAAVHLMPSQGPAAAQSVIMTAASCFKKLDAVFAVGVACGVKPKTDLLDVIVADTVTFYTDARLSSSRSSSGDECYKIERRSTANLKTSQKYCQYFKKQPDWSSFIMNRLVKQPRKHFGNVLSGNYLIDNEEIKKLLLENFAPKAIGIEMESAGLFHDYECGNHNVQIMLVKAVCDFGDGKKNKDYQPTAALLAAECVHYYLR